MEIRKSWKNYKGKSNESDRTLQQDSGLGKYPY